MRFLQVVLDNCPSKANMPCDRSVPTALEAQLYFYAMVVISRKIGKKNLRVIKKADNSTLVCMAVQLVKKDLGTLTKSRSLVPLRVVT